jgi:prophage regulatory protein
VTFASAIDLVDDRDQPLKFDYSYRGLTMNILRLPELKKVFGYRADASVYNAIRAGLLTTGVAISQRSKGWPDFEAQAIAAARVAGKTDAEIKALVCALHAKRALMLEVSAHD